MYVLAIGALDQPLCPQDYVGMQSLPPVSTLPVPNCIIVSQHNRIHERDLLWLITRRLQLGVGRGRAKLAVSSTHNAVDIFTRDYRFWVSGGFWS